MQARDEQLGKQRAKPFISLFLLICLNIGVFIPAHIVVKIVLLCIVSIATIVSRLRWNEISGIIVFLMVNFAWMIIIFYFVSFDWLVAAGLFFNYALAALVLTMGTCIFWKITPARDLAVALCSIKMPRSLALAIVVGTMFLPLIATSIKEIRIAQQARGMKMSLIKLVSIIIPAILRILDLSVDMSLSMQSRGYEI